MTWHIFCSVTVENTYDNIDIMGEDPPEVGVEGCEPEETYIIPNCGPRISEASSTNTNIYTNLLPNNNSEQGTFSIDTGQKWTIDLIFF